eukprot:16436510-Heterocapsa_arctica.AAC.1
MARAYRNVRSFSTSRSSHSTPGGCGTCGAIRTGAFREAAARDPGGSVSQSHRSAGESTKGCAPDPPPEAASALPPAGASVASLVRGAPTLGGGRLAAPPCWGVASSPCDAVAELRWRRAGC